MVCDTQADIIVTAAMHQVYMAVLAMALWQHSETTQAKVPGMSKLQLLQMKESTSTGQLLLRMEHE